MRIRDEQDACAEHLRTRVDYWSKRLRATPRVVRVQRMTRKWGSCSDGGTITLAEDLALQAPEFQDFVIAHELLHLRVPKHGRVFKALMSIYLPDWRAQDEVRRSRIPSSRLRRDRTTGEWAGQ